MSLTSSCLVGMRKRDYEKTRVKALGWLEITAIVQEKGGFLKLVNAEET